MFIKVSYLNILHKQIVSSFAKFNEEILNEEDIQDVEVYLHVILTAILTFINILK